MEDSSYLSRIAKDASYGLSSGANGRDVSSMMAKLVDTNLTRISNQRVSIESAIVSTLERRSRSHGAGPFAQLTPPSPTQLHFHTQSPPLNLRNATFYSASRESSSIQPPLGSDIKARPLRPQFMASDIPMHAAVMTPVLYDHAFTHSRSVRQL